VALVNQRGKKKRSLFMAKIIGIDLGTTNSVVAVMEGGQAIVIPNQEGDRTTASVVGFTDKGEILVGKVAKRQAITNPTNTVFSIKRFMGRKYAEVQSEMQTVPYKVGPADNGDAWVEVRGKRYSPPEISAMILRKLKEAAEAYLGEKVTQAVITVPAYFNDSQRQATKDAGRIAGLDVMRIINEPTAAALAYGLDKKKDETIAVYDFGGGTFDISVLEVGEGILEVKSTNGDTHLGGDDLDKRLIDFVVDEFRKENGIDLSKDPMALQRLKEACERAKVELSGTLESEINLPFITADASGPKHLQLKITRTQFENLCGDIFKRTMDPCKSALNDAKLSPNQIHEAVLVGGSTRIPKVQQMVQDFFGREPHKGVNPDEVVAVGAAIQAGVLGGDVKDILLLDVTPLTLGVETLGGVATPLIQRNTTIPARRKETFTTAADNQTEVEIVIFQGERPMARDNKVLGTFKLMGLPPSPRGVPQVEVAFDIDANGILNVHAKDTATGKEQGITITASSGLTKDEIDNKIREADQNKVEDQKRKEEVEAKNQADQMLYSTEKLLQDNAGKLPAEDEKKVREALEDLKKAKDAGNLDSIRRATDALNTATHKMAEGMYAQARPQEPSQGGPGPEPPGGPGGGGGKGGEVIDAEFEDVK
jgi:molecular chaperone DnaK